jgi:hypothetical protein
LRVDGDELRKGWSKALSGFANTDGGVLVWGIDAPDNAPVRLSLVQDLRPFNAKLQELLRDATDPPVQSVQIELYADPQQPTKGIIVCLIPRSRWRPHQAKSSVNEYYIRAGDNHVPASQSVLRALFYPEFRAQMVVYWKGNTTPDPGGGKALVVTFWLENNGPGSAEDVFVLCRGERTGEFIGGSNSVWKETVSGYPGKAAIATRPFHHTEMIPLYGCRLGSITPAGEVQIESGPWRFTFLVHSRNQPRQEIIASVTQDHLNDGQRHRAFPIE